MPFENVIKHTVSRLFISQFDLITWKCVTFLLGVKRVSVLMHKKRTNAQSPIAQFPRNIGSWIIVPNDCVKELTVVLQNFQLSQVPNEIRYFSCEVVVRCPAACTRKYITLSVWCYIGNNLLLLYWAYRIFKFLSFENVEGNGPLKPELSKYLQK